jgi:MinD superfamily P-loop ATPase
MSLSRVLTPDMSILLKTRCARCAFCNGACRIDAVRNPAAH